MESNYKHWMQRVDSLGNPTEEPRDIEQDFGLLYVKMEGINDIGKAKNVYTETYADSDRLRVFVPDDDEYCNEATVVKFTAIFCGESDERQSKMYEFGEYVRRGIHRYWDNARNRQFDFVVIDDIKVTDEKFHGSTKYVEVEYPLQNLNGSTRQRTV